jgi:IclR family pca regulon transcriptional regulator
MCSIAERFIASFPRSTMNTPHEPEPPADIIASDPNFMLSLARGLAVLQAFSDQRRSLTIAQISHRTAIPRASVRRCLHTLIALGYAGADGNQL